MHILDGIKRALIIEPHADDLVIGCGGVIQFLVEREIEIFSILLSPSPKIYEKIKNDAMSYVEYSWEDRFKELKRAMDILGFSDVDIPFLDNAESVHHKLDTIPQYELIKILEEKVKRCSPDLVFIPEKSYNQDHRTINDAFMTVVRQHFYNGTVLAYETTMEMDFEPNCLVPLSDKQFKKKIDACKCYETQLGCSRHLFSLETMEISMRYRGRLVFSDYGEAFRVVRLVLK